MLVSRAVEPADATRARMLVIIGDPDVADAAEPTVATLGIIDPVATGLTVSRGVHGRFGLDERGGRFILDGRYGADDAAVPTDSMDRPDATEIRVFAVHKKGSGARDPTGRFSLDGMDGTDDEIDATVSMDDPDVSARRGRSAATDPAEGTRSRRENRVSGRPQACYHGRIRPDAPSASGAFHAYHAFHAGGWRETPSLTGTACMP
jgi:hypothetical protein